MRTLLPSLIAFAIFAASSFAPSARADEVTYAPGHVDPKPVASAEPEPDAAAEPEPKHEAREPAPNEGGTVVTLYGFGAAGGFDGRGLSMTGTGDEPDVLKGKNLRVEGGGTLIGGGLRAAYLFPRWTLGRVRLGGGFGFFGFEDLSFRYDLLPEGVTATTGKAWGFGGEVFIGDEVSIGRVHPYLDLLVDFDVLTTSVTLHHPTLGALGSTSYAASAFGVGPRAGVLIPLGETFFLDLGGYATAFGAERRGGFLGISGRTRVGDGDDDGEPKRARRGHGLFAY